MTRRQSNNQWSGGMGAKPVTKKSNCKNPPENLSPRFFGIKTASFSFIIFQRAEQSTRRITYLCWCNWRTFWRKNAAGMSLRHSCSCTKNVPAHWALATQKKLAYLGFQCLDHPSNSPDPSDYHLFPGQKKQLKSRYFSCDAGFIAAAETWLEGQFS